MHGHDTASRLGAHTDLFIYLFIETVIAWRGGDTPAGAGPGQGGACLDPKGSKS